jgi:hypothetical protein
MPEINFIWLIIVLGLGNFLFMALLLFAVVVGAYAVFRTKYAYTGLSFMEPKKVNTNKEGSYSYMGSEEAFMGGGISLGDELLTEAAERIRDQRSSMPPVIQDRMNEVEGK